MDRAEQIAVQHMVASQLRNRGIEDAAVLRAMSRVSRRAFVPDASLADAYSDQPLPTAAGQTISQPYMVAAMTELLCVELGQRILEIGSGSGYQAAILASMGAMVVSVESNPALTERAREAVARAGFGDAVDVVQADGTLGWPSRAPYDRIIVTAGAPRVPRALQNQLAVGGRMVVPVGDRKRQRLYLVGKEQSRCTPTPGMGCRFVPLVGVDGWSVAEGD